MARRLIAGSTRGIEAVPVAATRVVGHGLMDATRDGTPPRQLHDPEAIAGRLAMAHTGKFFHLTYEERAV